MNKILLFLFFSFQLSIGIAQTDSLPVADSSAIVKDSVQDEINATFPVFSVAASDLNDDLGSQDISGILQSSQDIFTRTAGFNFGFARFRIRGYEPENTSVLINGINMNDIETGFASWSTWGGLNDITRFREVNVGIHPSDITFGGIGGYSSIDARASAMRKGNRFSYSLSNRNFTHRFMYTTATGMMENGWAVGVSASRRWGNEGYVEGTFMDAWSYLVSVEKKINEKHSINFTGFGAPTIQGKQIVVTQEGYDLAGTNFYNPAWGYQNGVKRNAKVNNAHKPMAMLNHYWKLNDKTKITTSAFFSKGRNGNTGINWNDAKDPRPDYYKNYPSYYKETSPETFEELTDLWHNDVNTRQVNWDNFYFANSKNLYTVQNAGGIAGNNVTGNLSKYILEEQRNDQTYYGVNSVVNSDISEKLNISGGVNAKIYSDHYFKVMNDLLGGDFWLDVDKFAEGTAIDTTAEQNNLSQPNKVIKKGDVFGYDYNINEHKYEGFAQALWTLKHVDFYVGTTLSNTTFWRTGNWKNGKFPDNSLGDSEKKSFTNYGVKSGVTYKISGRQYVSFNTAYLTRAPLPNVSFISPKTRNELLPYSKSEKVFSSDINYTVRMPKLKLRATAYYSEFRDQIWFRSFYHDVYKTFGNYFMLGVNNVHYGIELGAEANITSSILFTAVAAKGQYLYSSRPTNFLTRDNSAEIIRQDETIYLMNYRVGGKPQTAASLGLKYKGSNFWFLGINGNYFDDIWVDANPDRRTERAVQNFIPSDPQYDEILKQEKLPANYTVDLYAGKSFKIKKYFLNLNLTVNNLLNNKKFITSGFEQLRYSPSNIDKFPPKYSYYYGLTYFLNVSFRF